MSELLEDIRKYWTKRAKGYSEYNQGELSGEQREKWRQAILAELPDKPLTVSIFWMWEPAQAFLLSFWRRQGFR